MVHIITLDQFPFSKPAPRTIFTLVYQADKVRSFIFLNFPFSQSAPCAIFILALPGRRGSCLHPSRASMIPICPISTLSPTTIYTCKAIYGSIYDSHDSSWYSLSRPAPTRDLTIFEHLVKHPINTTFTSPNALIHILAGPLPAR
jgi:hypothetical protein